MEYKEYCTLRAFERVFANLGELEDYGVATWCELYDQVWEDEKLIMVNGEETDLCERYMGADLFPLLEEELDEIMYIVAGVKRLDVDLSGVK